MQCRLEVGTCAHGQESSAKWVFLLFKGASLLGVRFVLRGGGLVMFGTSCLHIWCPISPHSPSQMSRELFLFIYFYFWLFLCVAKNDPELLILLLLSLQCWHVAFFTHCGGLDLPECKINALPTEPYPQSPRKTFFVSVSTPRETPQFLPWLKSHPHFCFQRFNNFFESPSLKSLLREQYHLTEGQFCLPRVPALTGGISNCHSLLLASSG